MKKAMLTLTLIAMLMLVACGDAKPISDSKPMTDAEIIAQKMDLSKDFLAPEWTMNK